MTLRVLGATGARGARVQQWNGCIGCKSSGRSELSRAARGQEYGTGGRAVAESARASAARVAHRTRQDRRAHRDRVPPDRSRIERGVSPGGGIRGGRLGTLRSNQRPVALLRVQWIGPAKSGSPQVKRPSGPKSRLRSFGSSPDWRARSCTVSSSFISARPIVLDLFRRQRALLHPPQRLSLHHLADEIDERQHQLHHRSTHVLRIRIPARRRRAALDPLLELAGEDLKLLDLLHAHRFDSTSSIGI